MEKVFLRAQWRDLILANYAVDPGLLEKRLAPGLELDLLEGRAVCSLVGFRFVGTHVIGVRWPGFVDFPEINLRFYVRETGGGRRGVVFVRELVRSRLVAAVARGLYSEPYSRARITDRVESEGDDRRVEYRFDFNGGAGRMMVWADREALVPPEDSAEHWFKEHRWGYGKTRRGKLLRYEVRHPVWACHEVREASIEVDWGRVYGAEWGMMGGVEPLSVMLAQGSGVSVGMAGSVMATRCLPRPGSGPRGTARSRSSDRCLPQRPRHPG